MQVNYAWEWPKTDDDYAKIFETSEKKLSEIHIWERGDEEKRYRLRGIGLKLEGDSELIKWGETSSGGSRMYFDSSIVKKVKVYPIANDGAPGYRRSILIHDSNNVEIPHRFDPKVRNFLNVNNGSDPKDWRG